jgi:signal transduction histidine kinase
MAQQASASIDSLKDAEAPPPRAQGRLTPLLRWLLVASLAVPLLLLAFAAGQNYRLVRIEVQDQAEETAGQMHEHALKVLETYALVLAWIDDRTRDLSWEEISHSEGLHHFLADIEDLPQIDAVWIIDSAGHPRASGRLYPVPAGDVADTEYFKAQKRGGAGLYIAQRHQGRLTHAPEFTISRRRTTLDGGFDGIITVDARPGYFRDFYSTISQQAGFTATLLRSDGSVLVRYPATAGSLVLSPGSPLMRAIVQGPDRGVFRGRPEPDEPPCVCAYRRIEGYPIYVVFGIPRGDIFAAWGANLISYSLFAVPASAALFLLTLFAARQLQRQRLASWRWQATARRLRAEIDRRAQAEAELLQAQKMEALGQLTGGVAHDFNNLLTVLQGNLELLSGRQRDQRLEARIEQALQTVGRGERLTQQLLAFARRQPLKSESLDLNAHLRSMMELLARSVGDGVTIDTELAADLGPIEADPTQLELAVINLALNARDAMPEGGRLRIRTLKASPAGSNFVALEVSDTGCGIAAQVLARVFEPFFTTKEPGKGTGLGLSMVYGFARQSGGTATIRSTLGAGTTVVLHLPLSRAAQDHAKDAARGLPAEGRA